MIFILFTVFWNREEAIQINNSVWSFQINTALNKKHIDRSKDQCDINIHQMLSSLVNWCVSLSSVWCIFCDTDICVMMCNQPRKADHHFSSWVVGIWPSVGMGWVEQWYLQSDNTLHFRPLPLKRGFCSSHMDNWYSFYQEKCSLDLDSIFCVSSRLFQV